MSVRLNLARVQIGKESAFSTEASSYFVYPKLVSRGEITPTIKETEIAIQHIGSRNEAIQALHGESEYGVKINGRLQNGKPFFWLMGAENTTGADPYTHAITNNNTIPSFSIEHIIDSDYSLKYLGCKLDELVLTMTKGQPVMVNCTFKAAKQTVDTSPGTPPSVLTTVPYEFHQTTTFTVNSVAYKTKVRQIVMTLGNGLDADWGLSSRDPTTITEGLRKCMITTEIYEADETLLSLLKSRTDFAISWVITRGSDTITITVSNAKIFETSYDYGGNAIVDILPIRVIGDWTITVVDSTAVYDE